MESQSGKPSTRRLVIRVKLPKGSPPAPVRRSLSRRGALLLIAGAVAVVLSWVGISMFRAAPTSAPAPSEAAPAPVVSDEPRPKPATQSVEPKSAEMISPKVAEPPDAAPSPVNEVIPDVPRSARQTIRGTIRVSVRVIVDKGGTVILATADEPGPSRYFERLALEASRKWTFAPQDSAEQRITLVRFYFTRAGTKAHANPLQACKSC